MTHRFTLLIGSNWQASQMMEAAIQRLNNQFSFGLIYSKIHESPAENISSADAPPYLNAVCVGQTTLSLTEFEQWLTETELSMGRQRGPSAKGCVSIDLDLVVWDHETLRPSDATRSYYLSCLADL